MKKVERLILCTLSSINLRNRSVTYIADIGRPRFAFFFLVGGSVAFLGGGELLVRLIAVHVLLGRGARLLAAIFVVVQSRRLFLNVFITYSIDNCIFIFKEIFLYFFSSKFKLLIIQKLIYSILQTDQNNCAFNNVKRLTTRTLRRSW